MWEYFTSASAEARKILADASREKQEGIQGQWQQESPCREVLEQFKKKCGCRLWSQMLRRVYFAMKTGSLVSGPSKEVVEPSRKRKSTDFLRRIIDGMGGSLCRYNSFPSEDYFWWVSTGHGDCNNRKKRHCSWWCAAGGGHYEWRAPNRILVVQIGTNANEAKVFKAHAAPYNLINALKRLANQQKDGDSPIQSIVTGPHERCKKRTMDGLRNLHHRSRQSQCCGCG